ncbi:YuzL family protein [Peribacillus saganii]|uniref:YuzL family protein n=1 Tax=Peribacillus saganii TaxID=2303992 RepID=A0A372LIY6_9BACI|nr:YuzL family protein [Peribacillus saganii]RFU66342.1 YuzL family protein [Peribacillus saganii]
MAKRKTDPSTIGLGSSQPEGQGTTNRETGSYKADSTRKKKKAH